MGAATLTIMEANDTALAGRLDTIEAGSYVTLADMEANDSGLAGRLDTVEGWGDWSGEGFATLAQVEANDTALAGRLDTLEGAGYITAAGVPAAETDAAHDECSEISGCVVGAATLTIMEANDSALAGRLDTVEGWGDWSVKEFLGGGDNPVYETGGWAYTNATSVADGLNVTQGNLNVGAGNITTAWGGYWIYNGSAGILRI